MLSWRSLNPTRRAAAAAPRWPRRSAPVARCTLRLGFLPATFWQGEDLHRVTQVAQIRDEAGAHGGRRYYRVRCADGRQRTLIHDLGTGSWRVQI